MDLFVLAAFVLGIFLLIKGSDWIVISGSQLGQRMRIKPMLIALTLVAFGTSLPELSVSTASALQNNPDIALGNVVGSCIANILLIMGLSAVIRPLKVEESTMRTELPLVVLANIILLLFVIDMTLSFLEGIGLLIAFFLIFFIIYKRSDKGEAKSLSSGVTEIKDWKKELSVLMRIFEFLDHMVYSSQQPPHVWKKRNRYLLPSILTLGIVMVIIGAEFTVSSSIELARGLGIPPFVIALLLVSLGTSLPELFVSSWASYKKEPGISTGNVMGSNLFNILLVLGIAVVINPIGMGRGDILVIIFMVMVNSLMAVFLLSKRTLSRREGAIMLVIYVIYVVLML